MAVASFDNEYYVSDGDFTIGDQPVLTFEVGGNDFFQGESRAYSYEAVGDGMELSGTARGGNDVFAGGNFVENLRFAGDAVTMSDNAVGGKDRLSGGTNSSNQLVGDASEVMWDNSRGGNDTINGGGAFSDSGWSCDSDFTVAVSGPSGEGYASNVLIGDAYSFGESDDAGGVAVVGGRDTINGGQASSFDGYAGALNVIVGDANGLWGESRGGIDALRGGHAYADGGTAFSFNAMAGDGYSMGHESTGGADKMNGGYAWGNGGNALAFNFMAGDAFQMADDAVAGNDIMRGGDSHISGGQSIAFNVMAGDTFSYSGEGALGKDRLTGGSSNGEGNGGVLNVMFGDIGSGNIGPFTRITDELSKSGGSLEIKFANDTLTGGDGNVQNFMVGDAETIDSDSRGGNDMLVGGNSLFNLMIGDAGYIAQGGKGGNDKLFSGPSTDEMWGDAQEMDGDGGADKFNFGRNNGTDVVHDFRKADGDKIVLLGFRGINEFQSFASFKAAGRIEQQEEGVLLYLDVDGGTEDNTVFLMGVMATDLSATNFTF